MNDPWKGIAHFSKDQIRDLQNKKLYKYINEYIYPFSPHYRKTFQKHGLDPRHIRTVEDLKHIPFTSKIDFMDGSEEAPKYKDFILQPTEEKIRNSWNLKKKIPLAWKKLCKGKEGLQFELKKEFRPVFMTYTTGTTNKPTPFLYTNHDMANLGMSGARMINLFELKDEDNIANIFPYAPHLAFWQVVSAGFASCAFILSTGGGKTLGTEGNIKALLKLKPSTVLGVPSFIYHVLRVAKEQGAQMPFLKKVVLGASKVTIGFKLKCAQLLAEMGSRDVSIFGTYGFTESRCAWAESPTPIQESSGYHLYPDKEIFEVIDPETGEVKGDGEDGELVYTSLDGRASSVIRYRTGDFVKGGIQYTKCPYKGWYVPRISSDITRLSDVKDLQLSKIKGALVNLNHFAEVLSNISQIDEWQIEIGKKHNDPYEVDIVTMYICAHPGFSEEDLSQKIKKEMISATEVSPNVIQFISMEEIVERLGLENENKAKRIVDARPKG